MPTGLAQALLFPPWLAGRPWASSLTLNFLGNINPLWVHYEEPVTQYKQGLAQYQTQSETSARESLFPFSPHDFTLDIVMMLFHFRCYLPFSKQDDFREGTS